MKIGVSSTSFPLDASALRQKMASDKSLRIYTIISLLDIIHRPGPEIETSSVDWAQLSRLLSEDGDRIQSPKRCF
jgi:hypothetical protein